MLEIKTFLILLLLHLSQKIIIYLHKSLTNVLPDSKSMIPSCMATVS